MYNREIIERILIRYTHGSGLDLFDKNLHELISQTSLTSAMSSEKVLVELWNLIKKNITRYDKYEIYYLTEFMREQYACRIVPKDAIYQLIELNEIALIVQTILGDIEVKWGNRKLDINIVNCLEKIKIYVIADINSKLIKDINTDKDLLDLLVPNSEEKLNEFLDTSHIEQDGFDKFESSVVHDQLTREYLHINSMDLNSLKLLMFKDLKSELGFTYNEFSLFKSIIARINSNYIIKKKFTHINSDLDMFYNEYFYESLDRVAFNKIVCFFSLGRYSLEGLPNARMMELLCFKIDEYNIQFGTRYALETLTIFEHLLTSGHFNDEIGINVPSQIVGIYNNRISKYFSYYVADLLNKNGFIIPRTNNGEFYVEINKIERDGKVVSFNDIDVLAFDVINKLIYNCELKYYKPSMTYKSMVQSTLKSKLKNNILNRQKLIEDNKEMIGELLIGEDVSDYNVKSCIITSRPSMIPFNSDDSEVKCYALTDILNNRLRF